MGMTPRPRTDLQTLLESIVPNVYFKPPPSFKLKYPCVVYDRNTYSSTFANNDSYLRRTRYTLTLIDKNPDSIYINFIADIPYCQHTRSYIADNLNHDVYDLYW